MKYNRLGDSGIKVSELSFGSWNTFGKDLPLDKAKLCIRAAVEHGVNFFDNAEAYAAGESERIMGEILKDYRREDLVVSTKIFWGGSGPNDVGLSRKHLLEGTKNSLKRLQLDYVDLIFCHRPDFDTPLEETVYAMDTIVRSGMALYWGTSEWSSSQIEKAHSLAKAVNAISPTMEQVEYNMFRRDRVEKEYRTLFEERGMGATIWSPLSQGLLTGKYNEEIPLGSRFDKNESLKKKLTRENIFKVKALCGVAEEMDCSMSQLALAWCLKNPFVSTAITGASRVEQIHENMQAVNVKAMLNDEAMSKIENILQSNFEDCQMGVYS